MIHAQAQSLQDSGEVPGVDQLAIDRGLAAHFAETGAEEESRRERMAAERLIEPADCRSASNFALNFLLDQPVNP